MKTLLLSTLLIFYSLSAVQAAGNEYRLGVDGLACPFCVYGIEKQLQKLDGVVNLEVNIHRGVITVRMQEGRTLTEARAGMAVKKAGFKLRSFSPAK